MFQSNILLLSWTSHKILMMATKTDSHNFVAGGQRIHIRRNSCLTPLTILNAGNAYNYFYNNCGGFIDKGNSPMLGQTGYDHNNVCKIMAKVLTTVLGQEIQNTSICWMMTRKVVMGCQSEWSIETFWAGMWVWWDLVTSAVGRFLSFLAPCLLFFLQITSTAPCWPRLLQIGSIRVGFQAEAAEFRDENDTAQQPFSSYCVDSGDSLAVGLLNRLIQQLCESTCTVRNLQW